MNDLYFVVSESTPHAFEKTINEAAADGMKILPLSIHLTRLNQYECVMAKPNDSERKELEARAKGAGLHIVEPFGV